jgi:putative addiction module antidote
VVELKVQKIGSSHGVILPKEIMDRLRVVDGDTIVASDTPDGFLLSPNDPKFARALEGFGRVRHRYRDALRELAK